MAVYYSDCSDLSTAWAEAGWQAGTQFTQGSGVISCSPTSSVREVLSLTSFDADSGRANVDLLFRWRFSVLELTSLRQWLHWRGVDSSNFYFATLRSGTSALRIGKRVSGTNTADLISISFTASTDTWYWVRIRHQSDNVIKAKIWAGAASDEPGGVASDSDWGGTVTDSSVTSAGYAGPGSGGNSTTGTVNWDDFGFGTGGDWGPSSAPSAGAPTLGTASAINITATSATPRLTATW